MRLATFRLSGNAHDRRKQFRVRSREILLASPFARIRRRGAQVTVDSALSGKVKR